MLWLWFKPLETAICAIALGMIFGSTKEILDSLKIDKKSENCSHIPKCTVLENVIIKNADFDNFSDLTLKIIEFVGTLSSKIT